MKEDSPAPYSRPPRERPSFYYSVLRILEKIIEGVLQALVMVSVLRWKRNASASSTKSTRALCLAYEHAVARYTKPQMVRSFTCISCFYGLESILMGPILASREILTQSTEPSSPPSLLSIFDSTFSTAYCNVPTERPPHKTYPSLPFS